MSKRRRSRAAGPEVLLTDVKRLFSEELERQMVEMGFSIERYGRDTCEAVVRECVDRAYWQAWDEFMDWVQSGDSAGAELRALLREPSYTRPTQIVKL